MDTSDQDLSIGYITQYEEESTLQIEQWKGIQKEIDRYSRRIHHHSHKAQELLVRQAMENEERPKDYDELGLIRREILFWRKQQERDAKNLLNAIQVLFNEEKDKKEKTVHIKIPPTSILAQHNSVRTQQ